MAVVVSVAGVAGAAALVHTHMAADQATAVIERCTNGWRGFDICYGTWTDSRGRHTERIDHVGRDRLKEHVQVRVGVFGPHAGGVWRDGLKILAGLGVALSAIGLIGGRPTGPMARAARRWAADPGDDVVLMVDREQVRHSDGRVRARTVRRQSAVSFADSEGGVHLTLEEDGDGRTRVIGPEGHARAVIEPDAKGATIRHADGRLLGTVRGVRNAFVVLDENGAARGRAARRQRGEWVLRFTPRTAPFLEEAATAALAASLPTRRTRTARGPRPR
ncbi:hypothetical protein ACQEU3_39070 [Spirillospora sp. CA-253888]